MSAASFDLATGRLDAPRAAIEALLEGGSSPDLERAGALVDGDPHPRLAAALATIREPLCEMGLQRGDREGRGWVSPALAVLLVPGQEGCLTLRSLPPAYLPVVLARMNDLGPRPRADRPERHRFAAGELAQLLATRGPGTLAATLREHWRVELSWAPSPESPGVRALEVVDTDEGIWLVVPDGAGVELWPSTPTMVFRLLTGLLPRDHELAA